MSQNESLRLIYNILDEPTLYQPWINQVNVVRTSESYSRFEGRFAYGLNSRFWEDAKNTNGTRTYLPNQHGVEIGCGTTAGDAYYDITNRIFFYQPDTVVHAATAIVLNTESNVQKLWGLASYQSGAIQDGYLLRNTNGVIDFAKVSSASGTPVTTSIPRFANGLGPSWHDPFDGTGPSAKTLDFNDLQMVEITHAWYGGGIASLYFRIGGKSYLAASFKGGANGSDEPIIGNPNLSILYGVEALDTLSTPAAFKHWGLSVSVDGNKDETGILFGTYADPITASGGAWTPILSIRLKSTYAVDGATPKPNVYGYLTNVLASVSCTGRDSIVAIVRDPVLTGASFANIPDVAGAGITDSMVERDISATAFTGGIITYTRAVPSGQAIEIDSYSSEFLSLNALGTEQPIVTIAARPLTGGNASVGAGLAWKEVY